MCGLTILNKREEMNLKNRVLGLIKRYYNAGSVTKYDRAFLDLFKFNGEIKDYVGAIFNAIEIHGFYFSKAKFRVYETTGETSTEVPDHKFNQIFKKPSSLKTWWEYAYKIPAYWGLWGTCYFHVKRNILNSKPEFYQQIPPALIEKRYKDNGALDYYEYNDGTNKIPLKIEDIIELRYPNPYSENDGYPIINSVADQKTVNALQMHYMKKFFENGGFMGLVFTTTQAMSKPNFERTLKMLEEKFMGMDKAYKEVGLFDSGLQPIRAAYDINQMGIADSRKLTKDDIYEAWKVSKIHVGSGELANRAANDAAIYQFTSGVIDPLLSYVDNVFTLFVQREFGDKYEVVHDTLAPKDIEGKLKYYESGLKNGWLTINEVRKDENWNKDEGELADVLIINPGGGLIRVDTGKQIGVEDGQKTPNQQTDAPATEKRGDADTIRKSMDEDWKKLKWKQFDTRSGISLRRFEKKLDRYFGDQEKRILDAIKNNFIVEEAFNLQEENMLLYQLLEIDLWDIMKDGHKFGVNQYGGDYQFNKDLLAGDFKKLAENTTLINNTTFSQIKDIKDETQMQAKYREIRDGRLKNIALTTVTGAFNSGLLQAMKSAGIGTKMWLSQRDNKVRDAHKLMDGVTVPIDEPFEVENNGKRLGMYPGDVTLGAENNSNERCTIISGD